MRVSRGCYDKFHRCPGWAGGGFKTAKTQRCDSGHIRWYVGTDRDIRLWQFRFLTCDRCDVVVWPHVTRWVDPVWLYRFAEWRWELWRWNRTSERTR